MSLPNHIPLLFAPLIGLCTACNDVSKAPASPPPPRHLDEANQADTPLGEPGGAVPPATSAQVGSDTANPGAEHAQPLLVEPFIPQTLEDLDRLIALGYGTSRYVVVEDTDALLEAFGSDETIVLLPGEYRIPDTDERPNANPRFYDGEYVHDIHGLTVIGLGTPPPRIIKNAASEAILAFRDTSKLTLYNLSIGHSEPIDCSGSVLFFDGGEDIRLIHTDLFGSGARGFAASNVAGFELSYSTVRDCSWDLAMVRASTRVNLFHVDLVDNDYLKGGFFVWGSELEIRDSTIRGNRLRPKAPHAPLFSIDARWETGPALVHDLRIPPGDTSTIDSQVVLDGVTLLDNGFDRLTDRPPKLSRRDPPLPPGQFRSTADRTSSEFWCHCRRARRSGSFPPETICIEQSREDCTDSIAATSSGVLANSMVSRCRPAYGDDHPGDWFGDRDGWSRVGESDTWRHEDACLLYPEDDVTIPAAAALPSLALPRPSTPPISWASLGRLRAGEGKSDGISVEFESTRTDMPRHLQGPLDAGDAHIPPTIVRATSLFLVTEAGIDPIGPLSEVFPRFLPELSRWDAVYPPGRGRGVGVVTMGAPHASAKIRRSSPAIEVPHDDIRVRALLASVEVADSEHWRARRWRSAVEVQEMAGVFPGGATRVVAVMLEEAAAHRALNAVFTVDDHHELVQVVRPAARHTSHLLGLVDLDGDGIDEVLLKTVKDFEADHDLMRLTESEVELNNLSRLPVFVFSP